MAFMESVAPTRTVDIPVSGMHCAGCVASVERLLGQVDGVEAVAVNLIDERAQVAGEASLAALGAALERGGFGMPTRTIRLAGEVDPAALVFPGVLTVEASPGGHDVRVIDRPEVIDRLRGLVGEADRARLEADELRVGRAARRQKRALIARGAGALLAGVWLMALHLGWQPPLRWLGTPLAQLLLASVVQFGLAAPILLSAARGLRVGRADMDTLVSLGTLAAYGAGAAAVLSGRSGPYAFDGGAMIIALIFIGRWLEARARHQAGDAVRALAGKRAQRAHLLVASGIEDVPPDRLLVGDRIEVRPGEIVPADGRIAEGRSALDESVLTGESLPQARGIGDDITGGTTNGTGRLLVEVTAVGPASRLDRIARFVRDAQAQRAPVQRLADRVAAWFVPVILVLATLTFLGWWLLASQLDAGIQAAAAVLLIACPCALGLATPTAMVVASGRAARMGLLVRGGAVFERGSGLSELLFDKTGTLTVGRPEVTAIRPEANADEILRVAASLERSSEHPLAGAVLRAAAERQVEGDRVTDFEALPGRGAWGRGTDGLRRRVGSLPWFEHEGLSLTSFAEDIAALDREGATLLAVAAGERVLGLIGARDPARDDAAAVLGRLRGLGLSLGVLSGDRSQAVWGLVHTLELPEIEIHAELSPEDKARLVTERVGRGQGVAMVGDGINDAPALASADVGLAVTGATELANESADVVLLEPRLALVADFLGLSRATMRIVCQNLGWAFGYNLVGVPLAAFGVLPPLFAAAAMALSSVSVVANALRLRTVTL